MRTRALEGMAVCDPVNAERRIAEYDPTPQEIAYLRSMIASLGTRMDRYISPAMRTKALNAAKRV